MLSPSEYSKLMKDRADAATRVLERRRVSLEAAIEALEVVGYKVYQGNDGVYNVQPPRDRASEYSLGPPALPTGQSPRKRSHGNDIRYATSSGRSTSCKHYHARPKRSRRPQPPSRVRRARCLSQRMAFADQPRPGTGRLRG